MYKLCLVLQSQSVIIATDSQLSHSVTGWIYHLHIDSRRYFSKRQNGRLYITPADISNSSELRRLEACIDYVDQRISSYMNHSLPQNIQIVLLPLYYKTCLYYMVTVQPNCHIFWLDDCNLASLFSSDGVMFGSLPHQSKSGLILPSRCTTNNLFSRIVHGVAILGTCCALSSCQYFASRYNEGRR